MQPPPTVNKSPLQRVADETSLRNRSPSLFQFNEKLLQDPNRLYQFKKFVETEYADEHLSFYLDVSQWKTLETDVARKQRADEILTTYVRAGAPKIINIEQRHLKALIKTYDEDRQCPATLFDVAMGEVFKLMKLDSYQRFSRSVFFQAMLTGTAVRDDAFGEDLFVKFLDLCTGREQPWAPIRSKHECESFEQKGADDRQLLKAVCEVRGTPSSVASILCDPALLPKWDKECVGSYELERFSERFTTVYVAYKGSLMGAAQTDFVLAQIMREFTDGTVCIISRSLPNGNDIVPEKKNFVRCRMETGGWMLEKLSEDRTRITSIQEVDYSGKANKRTLDAAKARIIAITGLREFLSTYKPAADRRKSVNL